VRDVKIRRRPARNPTRSHTTLRLPVNFEVMSGGTHEVWARVVWALVALAGEVELPVARLLEGLPFDEAGLRRRKRVAWDDYCVMTERLTEAAGGLAEFADLVAGSYHQTVPELRALAGSLVGPKPFTRFVVDVLDPIVFPAVEFTFEDLGEDHIRIKVVLRPGVRACEPFIVASGAAIRGLMMHLALPPAEILSSEVTPDHGIWEVRLPPGRTLVGRARRAARQFVMRFVIGAEPDGTPVHAAVGSPEVDPMAQRLEQAIATWKLTPRQADVLALVVTGKANKEIAKSLDCADNTIELHVTRVLRKAGFTSRSQLIAGFWSATWGHPP
jgi:DNA-binding CsgD family transcriptional regulator